MIGPVRQSRLRVAAACANAAPGVAAAAIAGTLAASFAWEDRVGPRGLMAVVLAGLVTSGFADFITGLYDDRTLTREDSRYG